MSIADDPGLFDSNSCEPPSHPAPIASTAFTGTPDEILPADLELLLGTDPAAASGRELVDLVVAAERLICWAQSRTHELMAALAVPGVPGPTENLARRIKHPEPDLLADSEPADGDDDIAAVLEWEAAQRLATDQLAAVLVQSPVTMRLRLNQAQRMVFDFPGTQAALASGQVCRSKAAVILDRLQFVSDPEIRKRLEDRAVVAAGGRAPGRLGSLIDRWVVAADPAAAERRRLAARIGRKVTNRPLPDGMGRLSADLPADITQHIHDLLSEGGRAARELSGEDDDRTLDHCRADLLSDIMLSLSAGESVSLAGLFAAAAQLGEVGVGTGAADDCGMGNGAAADCGADTGGVADCGAGTGAAADDHSLTDTEDAVSDHDCTRRVRDKNWSDEVLGFAKYLSPTRQGRPLQTVVTMTLEAFAQLSSDPATLAGYGTITADWARSLAQAARAVSILVVDKHGHAVGASDLVYRPRQHVRDQVITMNPTCVFGTCNRRACLSDLDHHETFCRADPAGGGATTVENLEPLCRRHHLAKTHGGWSSERNPDGSRTFISPLGTRTTSPAADHPVSERPPVPPPF